MRLSAFVVLGLLGLLLAPLAIAGEAEAVVARPGFTVHDLGGGIHAAIRDDPPGLMVDANCVFIVNESDVVVVDAPEDSARLIEALKAITDKPVSHLVNTHWHDDHVIGNALWRKAYPGVKFAGHAALHEYLPGTGLQNRKGMIEGGPGFAAQLQQALDQGRNLRGQPIDAEERASYASDIALFAHYMKVVPGTDVPLPDMAVTAAKPLLLQRGQRRIEIRQLGAGHTEADLVVWLPRERIAVTGDLVVWPIPLVGHPQSRVGQWPRTLEALLALRPKVLVPGHGPVMRDLAYPRLLVELFDRVQAQVGEAVAAGLDLAATRQQVDLAELRRRFVGDSRVRDFSFGMYVAGPAVEAAWHAAKAAAE